MRIGIVLAAALATTGAGQAREPVEISPLLWCASDAEAAYRAGAESGFRADMPDFRTDAEMHDWFEAQGIVIPDLQTVWDSRGERSPLCLFEAAPAWLDRNPSRAVELLHYAQFRLAAVEQACDLDAGAAPGFGDTAWALWDAAQFVLDETVFALPRRNGHLAAGEVEGALGHLLSKDYTVDLDGVCGGAALVGDPQAGYAAARGVLQLLTE
jgi:hypothetical protein